MPKAFRSDAEAMYNQNANIAATANNNNHHNHNNNNDTGSMYDDSMSDEVFEEPAVTAKRKAAAQEHTKIRHQHQQALAATIAADVADLRTKPSPSGYPGYTPPREALQMYASDNAEEYFQPDRDGAAARAATATATKAAAQSAARAEELTDVEVDGWKSYELEETFDDSIVHKVMISGECLVASKSNAIDLNKTMGCATLNHCGWTFVFIFN